MILKPDSFKSAVFVIVQFAAIILIILCGHSIPRNIYILILLVLFISIGVWALLVMKFRFNVAPDPIRNITLVKKGPYKFIRHPMYTSVLGTMACFVFVDFSALRFIYWLILLADLLMKLRYEEQLLKNLMPEYQLYSEQTRKIIPYIY